MADASFDLSRTFVHLGAGASASPVADFAWTEAFLTHYEHAFDAGLDAGRPVCISPQDESWTSWERNPAGEDLVVCLSGRLELFQELPGGAQMTRVAAWPGGHQPAQRVALQRGARAGAVPVHHPGSRHRTSPGVIAAPSAGH